MMQKRAIVIGAGIVGLAIARALAIKKYSVKVFDRSHRAVGASIRNFGMVWPIGQPSGKLYERALRSRHVWKQIGDEGAFWYGTSGSLHLAYEGDEWNVLQELFQVFKDERQVHLLTPEQIAERSGAVVQKHLLGGLLGTEELIVDPREAIHSLPSYLGEKYAIDFSWGKCVHAVLDNTVQVGQNEQHHADVVFVCSGSDLETLYPETYAALEVTKCKLQMMRLGPQPGDWKIGPALCGGLSLIHYNSFKAAATLSVLKERYVAEMKEYVDSGIHVMVSQNGKGELTVGDSHEYGLTPDPFDREFINRMILDYLKTFAQFKDWTITESWNGVYTKHSGGGTEVFFSPASSVYIVNALGGAGMTLSFGLAEDVINSI